MSYRDESLHTIFHISFTNAGVQTLVSNTSSGVPTPEDMKHATFDDFAGAVAYSASEDCRKSFAVRYDSNSPALSAFLSLPLGTGCALRERDTILWSDDDIKHLDVQVRTEIPCWFIHSEIQPFVIKTVDCSTTVEQVSKLDGWRLELPRMREQNDRFTNPMGGAVVKQLCIYPSFALLITDRRGSYTNPNVRRKRKIRVFPIDQVKLSMRDVDVKKFGSFKQFFERAAVTGSSWEYTNKDGSKDMRYSDNKKVDLYGLSELTFSLSGQDEFRLLVNDIDAAFDFYERFQEYVRMGYLKAASALKKGCPDESPSSGGGGEDTARKPERKTAKRSASDSGKAAHDEVATNSAHDKKADVKASTPSAISIASGKLRMEKTSFKYDGEAVLPKVAVETNGVTLEEGVDYTVSYANNVEPGTARVVVKGTGLYKDTLNGAYVIKLAKVSKLTLKGFAGGIKASWKYAKGGSVGYQLRYATDESMKDSKDVYLPDGSKSSVKLTELKAKKKYYVQVRTVKTVDGEQYRSAWSKVKSIKTKRA